MNKEQLDNNLERVNVEPTSYYAIGTLKNQLQSDIYLIKQTEDGITIFYSERGKEYLVKKTDSLENAYDFLWANYLDSKEKGIASYICGQAGLYDNELYKNNEVKIFVDKEILAPTRYITEMNYSKESIEKRLEIVKMLLQKNKL